MNNDTNYDAGSSTGTAHSSGTTVGDVGSSPQRLRISVPTAASELVLGLNDDGHLGLRARTISHINRDGWDWGELQTQNVAAQTSLSLGVDKRGFVGVLQLADHGNVFVCATGGADLGSDYVDAYRAQAIIETAMGVMRTALILTGAVYQGGAASNLSILLAAGQTVWNGFNAATSPMSGMSAEGPANMDYLQTGHVGLFGSRSVKLDSIEGVSSSSALFNSHTGGLSASLNSIVSASMSSGILASVTGAYSASLNGDSVAVSGTRNAKLSARTGTTALEGVTVRIGTRRLAGKVQKTLSGIQSATEQLWMRANGLVELGVPSRSELPFMETDDAIDGHLQGMKRHPTGLHVMPGFARLGTDFASHKLGRDVTSLAGKSLLRVGVGGIEIGRMRVAAHPVTHASLTAARLTYATALATTEGLKRQAEMMFSFGWKSVAGVAISVAGVAAATSAGVFGGGDAGQRAAGGDGNATKGDWVGKTVGGLVGGVAASVAVGLIAMKIAGTAQKAALAAAHAAYEVAISGALAAEIPRTILDPLAAKVEVKDDGVTISVGTSQIKMTASAIEIKGLKVTVNDIECGPGMIPAMPAPPVVPEVDAPIPGAPTPEPSPILAAMLD